MENTKKVIYSLLRSDGSIVINKRLMRAIGIDCSILFCELLSKEAYFAEREQLTEDGYFYCTVSDMEDSTTLSEHPQKKAVSKLISLGLIEYRIKGIPPVRYFKTTSDMDLICKYLSTGNSKRPPKPLVSANTAQKAVLIPLKRPSNNTNSIILNNDNDNGVFPDGKDTVNKDVVNAIKTYMTDLYVQKTKKKHAHLKAEQYKRVYQSISAFAEECSLDYDGIIEVMICYLNNNTLDTDYNINHFATEGIMMNRLYETGLV